MKFCPECGAQLPDESKFCTECGQKLIQPAPQAPVPAPVMEEAEKAPVIQASDNTVHVYGQPVNHNFSAPVSSAAAQCVVHTYGEPVPDRFSPAVQTAAAQSGSYTVAVPAAQPVAAAAPKKAAPQPPKAKPAPAPVIAEASAAQEEAVPAKAAPVKSIKEKAPKLDTGKITDLGKNLTGKIDFKGKRIRLGAIGALVLVVMILLFSCIGGKEPADPNAGIYKSISCNYAGMELVAEDDWIELLSGGKMTICLEGQEYSGKWQAEEGALTVTQNGDIYTGTIGDDVLTLDLGGVIYTYEKELAEDEIAEPDAAKPGEEEEAPAEKNEKKYYIATSGKVSGVEMNESTLQQMGGVSLVLNGDGTGTFDMFGQVSEITYDDSTIQNTTPMAYTIDGDYLYLQVSEVIEFTMMTKMDAMNRPQEDLTLDDLGYWEGDYYGWWVIDSVLEGNSDAQGNWWDCCMTLDIASDGSGSMIIWDEDYGRDDPIAEVDVSISIYDGVARIVSESGQFMGDAVEHADWLFYSDSTDYPDSLGFSAPYEDDSIKMDCYFFLRKWGTIWDDVEQKDLPGYYESWYLPLLDAGETAAPDTIG